MAKNEREVPTREEIAELPRWAIVAFAARCAKRIPPLADFDWPGEDERVVSRAIEIAGAIKGVRYL